MGVWTKPKNAGQRTAGTPAKTKRKRRNKTKDFAKKTKRLSGPVRQLTPEELKAYEP